MSQEIAEMTRRLVRALVDQPESVNIGVNPTDDGLILSIRVASGEVGQVIGKQGRSFKAIQTLLQALATKKRMRVGLEILEG